MTDEFSQSIKTHLCVLAGHVSRLASESELHA